MSSGSSHIEGTYDLEVSMNGARSADVHPSPVLEILKGCRRGARYDVTAMVRPFLQVLARINERRGPKKFGIFSHPLLAMVLERN